MRARFNRNKIPRFLELLFTFEGSPILLYDYQKKFLLDEAPFRIIMKARQLGLSWVIALEGLFTALSKPYQTILFVSSGEEAAKRVLQYVYSFIHGMAVPPKLLSRSMTECRFPNQSRIVSLPNNDRTVRGYRAHKVYCDEFAALLNDGDILAAIQPSISRGGSMTILSTPRGRANRFWDLWDDPASGYSRHRIPWTDCPDKEYRKMIRQMQKTMLDLDFRQEYCCDPSISDMAFFTRELLQGVVNPKLHYFSLLQTKNKVVMGIDFGKRVSSTAITIAERCPDKVRIRFQEELRNMPYDFAVGERSSQLKRIAHINASFDVDEINIDATGVGVRLEEDMRKLFGAKVESVIFSSKNKEIMITNLKILCEKHGIELVNDIEFITQLLALERDLTPSGAIRYKHIKGKKDDRVWSAALAVKDMLSPEITKGYAVGGDIQTVHVNRHIETLEPISPRHIISTG